MVPALFEAINHMTVRKALPSGRLHDGEMYYQVMADTCVGNIGRFFHENRPVQDRHAGILKKKVYCCSLKIASLLREKEIIFLEALTEKYTFSNKTHCPAPCYL